MTITKQKGGAIALQDLVIGVIFVSFTLLAIFAFLKQQTENVGVTNVEPEIQTMFSNTTNNLNATVSEAETLRQTIQTSNLVSVQGFAALFTGSFAVLRIVLNALQLPINIFTDVSNALGMPWWFLAGVSAILVVVIVLIIANIIFGRGRA